ncbi:MAG: GUN4 domain-containing protein [Leptolyngbyaceae cyanobacterium SM1_4_3]|nr:GUN4 domain-containing protein [Leptolyngbyaceae cyanobacterium SM1_4_3]NJN90151.1 GUN4 domain-containing protein [Leptolyngbyaceae cyanobacterium SL_5_14]
MLALWLTRLRTAVMLKTVNREAEGFDEGSIKNLSCDLISQVDRLWLQHSDGKFGFSVWERMYLECGGKTNVEDEKSWNCFGNRVGWRMNNDWIDTNNANFSKSAPVRHLPILVLPRSVPIRGNLSWSRQASWVFFYFMQRFDECHIN